MRPELEKKVKAAIKLLQGYAQEDQDMELCYSGGKDSDVILELAKMAGIPYTAIYKNTTIDPPGTIKHCLDNGVEIRRPRKTFFQLIAEKGYPSRWARFCCSELKEYKIKDRAILGIRREESAKRAARYTEPSVCRIYSKTEHVEQILPILDWTLQDIEEFVKERGIKLHPLYYNPDGSLNLSRRLGCLGCPLAKNNGLADFKEYPRLVRAWIRAGKKWWDAPRETPIKAKKYAGDIYEHFAARTFHDTYSEMTLNKEALFKTDYKAALEQYFHIKLE